MELVERTRPGPAAAPAAPAAPAARATPTARARSATNATPETGVGKRQRVVRRIPASDTEEDDDSEENDGSEASTSEDDVVHRSLPDDSSADEACARPQPQASRKTSVHVKMGAVVHIPSSVFPHDPVPQDGYWIGATVVCRKGGTKDIGIKVGDEPTFTWPIAEVATWVVG